MPALDDRVTKIDGPDDAVAAVVSPAGHIIIKEAGASPTPATRRLVEAFARGEGAGLLHLATAALDAALPPSLAWLRELARAFLTRLCTIPDLEEQRERVHVVLDPDALDALATGVPPITGAEYARRDALERLWGEMQSALADELRAH